MRQRRGGMTLIEMMMVVGIIGVLAAIAGVSATSMTRLGHVNGAADGLARLLSTTRSRSMTERCRYVLQINGTSYNPVSAPPLVKRRGNAALLYRKGQCLSGSAAVDPTMLGITADGGLRPDVLVDEFALTEYNVEIQNGDGGIITDGRLDTEAIAFSWNELGQRTITIDDNNDGVFAPSAVGNADVSINVRAQPGSNTSMPVRSVSVPYAGRASAQ